MAEVHITSYFSVETDLAGEMRPWPEFRSGAGYAVELASTGDGDVSVKLVEPSGDELPYVRITSSSAGPLFDRVRGRVTYALAAHSDNLMIERLS